MLQWSDWYFSKGQDAEHFSMCLLAISPASDKGAGFSCLVFAESQALGK